MCLISVFLMHWLLWRELFINKLTLLQGRNLKYAGCFIFIYVNSWQLQMLITIHTGKLVMLCKLRFFSSQLASTALNSSFHVLDLSRICQGSQCSYCSKLLTMPCPNWVSSLKYRKTLRSLELSGRNHSAADLVLGQFRRLGACFRGSDAILTLWMGCRKTLSAYLRAQIAAEREKEAPTSTSAAHFGPTIRSVCPSNESISP